MEHLAMFRAEHPELLPLEEAEYKDVLTWAAEKKYIRLRTFGRRRFYTKQQLETALMWALKEEVNFS